jgi:hypothetical protein
VGAPVDGAAALTAGPDTAHFEVAAKKSARLATFIGNGATPIPALAVSEPAPS